MSDESTRLPELCYVAQLAYLSHGPAELAEA
jgi:hypothetical protein